MTDLRTAAQQALKALEQSETFVPYEGFGMARREAERKHRAAITALRAALAEPVLNPAPGYCRHCKQYTIEEPLPAEPVQEPDDGGCDGSRGALCIHQDPNECKPERDCPAFSAPPQRKPEPNSDYERGFVDGMSEQARRSVDKAVNAMTKCKPLAEEEIARLVTNDMVQFARAIERAHGIT